MRKWKWSWYVLERAKFHAEWNNYFCAALKGDFLTSYSKGGVSFSSRSINIRTFAKILILTTRICLPLVLQNNYSLNAPNFRLTRAKNAGPKIMEHLSFWLIYILIWCNLCIFWILNGTNNLKTAHSKMVF